MRFKELYEARKNPEQNPKIPVYKQIEKYKDDPNIYLHFSNIKKVGIWPDASFGNSPLAIYGFPLKETWKKFNVASNKSLIGYYEFYDRKYVFILRAKKKIPDVLDYSWTDLSKAHKKLLKLYSDKVDVRDYINQYTDSRNHPFFNMYTLTNEISIELNENTHWTTWNSMLRKLEYYGFADRTGQGFIHDAEPIQAMFLSMNVLKVEDMFLNKDYDGER